MHPLLIKNISIHPPCIPTSICHFFIPLGLFSLHYSFPSPFSHSLLLSLPYSSIYLSYPPPFFISLSSLLHSNIPCFPLFLAHSSLSTVSLSLSLFHYLPLSPPSSFYLPPILSPSLLPFLSFHHTTNLRNASL